MTEPTSTWLLDDFFSDAAIDAVIALPGFRDACAATAAQALDDHFAFPEPFRWLMMDIGRTGIGLTAYLLDATAGGLTAQALRADCKTYDVASAGRVTQVLERLQQSGDLTLEDGPARWTQRRLVPSSRFLGAFARRMLAYAVSVERLAPERPTIAAGLADDSYRRGFVLRAAAFSIARRGLFAPSYSPYTELFLQREAGMLMLFDFITRQPPGRARLLESVTLSRNALARRFEVSRAHINKLIGDAVAAGLVRQEREDLLVFDPALSTALERVFAHLFQLVRAAAATAPSEGVRLTSARRHAARTLSSSSE